MPIARVVIGGILAGAQRWSIGVNLQVAGSTTPSPAQMNTFAQAVYASFLSNVWSNASSGLNGFASSSANVDSCHAYYYPVTITSGATATGVSSGAAVAGSGVRSNPPQSALVVSLRTALAGRKGRGRVYLPIGVMSYNTNGTIGSTLSGLATNFAAFLTNVSSGIALAVQGVTPIVVGLTVPTGSTITSVAIDNVMDTQRRRRDKIAASATVTANV